jgi:hypothetical protein
MVNLEQYVLLINSRFGYRRNRSYIYPIDDKNKGYDKIKRD